MPTSSRRWMVCADGRCRRTHPPCTIRPDSILPCAPNRSRRAGLASLRKLVVLDATDNAIEAIPRGTLPRSIRIINLKGNPITNKPGWKGTIVAMLPNVCCIDGVDIDRGALEAAVDAALLDDSEATADGAAAATTAAAAASLPRAASAAASAGDPFVTSPGALRRAAALASAAATDDRSRPAAVSAPTSATASTLPAVPPSSSSAASGGAGDDSPVAALAATAAHYTARREALSTLFKTRIDEEMKLLDAMAEQLAADSAAELTAAASRLQSAHASVIAKMRARDAELDQSLAQAREAFAAVSLAASSGPPRGGAAGGAAGDSASDDTAVVAVAAAAGGDNAAAASHW